MNTIESTPCFVCKQNTCSKTKYDIRKTYISGSQTLVISLIEDVVNDRVVVDNSSNVCSNCYDLLQELHRTRMKVKEICNTLCVFMGYNKAKTTNVYCQTDTPASIEGQLCQELNVDHLDRSTTLNNIDRDVAKPFECVVCFKGFKTKNGAAVHMKRQHTRVGNSTIATDNVQINNEVDIASFAVPADFDATKECNNKMNEPQVTNLSEDSDVKDDGGMNIYENTSSHSEPHFKYDTDSDSSTTNIDLPANRRPGRRKSKSSVSKRYKCSECPKEWKTCGELKKHMMSHSDARPFICEVCGQAYKQKSALDVHVGMHNGINPFKCDYCYKSFTQKGALQRHLPIHTDSTPQSPTNPAGETPYQCDLCGKRFVHHTSFNIHRLSHTKEKAYKCDICGLALLSGSHLKRHMRVHTGEKKYACATCGKRFAERYNLASHQRLHEMASSGNTLGRRKNRCPICGNTYEKKIKLHEHMVNEHQKEETVSTENSVKLQELNWPNGVIKKHLNLAPNFY